MAQQIEKQDIEWLYLSSRKRTIAIAVKDGIIVQGPPSVRWAMGKSINEVRRWLGNQGGYMEHLIGGQRET